MINTCKLVMLCAVQPIREHYFGVIALATVEYFYNMAPEVPEDPILRSYPKFCLNRLFL